VPRVYLRLISLTYVPSIPTPNILRHTVDGSSSGKPFSQTNIFFRFLWNQTSSWKFYYCLCALKFSRFLYYSFFSIFVLRTTAIHFERVVNGSELVPFQFVARQGARSILGPCSSAQVVPLEREPGGTPDLTPPPMLLQKGSGDGGCWPLRSTFMLCHHRKSSTAKDSDKIGWLGSSSLFKHLILHVGVTHWEENENTRRYPLG
jgi:hypothetical protein